MFKKLKTVKIEENVNINRINRNNLKKKRLIFLRNVNVFIVSQNGLTFITLVSCVISQEYKQENLCVSFKKQTKHFNHCSNG
jgi:hypothetical protein